MKTLKEIPQVDKLLELPELKKWSNEISREHQTRIIRKVLESFRKNLVGKKSNGAQLENLIENAYQEVTKNSLKKAINATGVVLHTNLGRAPISKNILEKLTEVLGGYSTLEVDTDRYQRGSRTKKVEELICLLTGAEAATVVNNNAGALLLILSTLFKNKEVLVSRGEIVQIGGGFRIHEILEESGAVLKEVGTTNITKLKDFEKRISKETGAVLRVHQSNFLIEGHTEMPSLEMLGNVCAKNRVPYLIDLGSGGLQFRAKGDPSISQALKAKASLVCFSGDKLLGASQAGLIIGKKEFIEKIKKSPLYRAFRLSKCDLFILEATLFDHLKNRPTLTDELISLSANKISERAKPILTQLQKYSPKLVSGFSSIGGGTTPQDQLETFLIEIPVSDSELVSRKLTQLPLPIFVRKGKSKILIDLRTVFVEEEKLLIKGLLACLS